MNHGVFDQLLKTMIEEELLIGSTKGLEYASEDDRLANFKRIAGEMGLSPEQVLWVYLKKHLDAIAFYIRSGSVLSEPIEGRIKDARVFLSLLRGLVEEKKEAQSKPATL